MKQDPPRLFDSTSNEPLRRLLEAGRSELPDAKRLGSISAGLAIVSQSSTVVASVATGAKAVSMSVATKVVILVVPVAIAVGGGTVAYRHVHSKSVPSTNVAMVKGATPDSPTTRDSAEPPMTLPPNDFPPNEDVHIGSLKARPLTNRGSASSLESDHVDEESETRLLQRAHASLASNPREALSLTSRHAKVFPSGSLAQEREVIAIDALMRMGRAKEARARAERFLSAYPSSGHAQHVKSLAAIP